jgi:hypothetical protein
MAKKALTHSQRKIQRELDLIFARIGLDYWDLDEMDPAMRIHALRGVRREVIRGEVVSQYTLLDEHLGSKIVQYLYPKKTFIKLWRTRNFQRFNFFILERMPLIQKLAMVKDIYRIPKSISETIDAVNALRNALAHAFVPENLKAYMSKGRRQPRKSVPVTYKGVDIFTIDGTSRFLDDMNDISDFFIWKAKRKRRKAQPERLTAPADASPLGVFPNNSGS